MSGVGQRPVQPREGVVDVAEDQMGVAGDLACVRCAPEITVAGRESRCAAELPECCDRVGCRLEGAGGVERACEVPLVAEALRSSEGIDRAVVGALVVAAV